MLIGYFVVGLCALGQFGVQATISIYLEDITLPTVDPEYIENAEATIVDVDGETTLSGCFDMIKEIPETAEGHFALWALSMGEYKMPTGLDVDMTMCDMIDEPIVIGPIFAELGFVSGECPVAPGHYKMERYKMPVDKFPDEFIENSYEGLFEISVDGKIILAVKVHAQLENLFDR